LDSMTNATQVIYYYTVTHYLFDWFNNQI
jgi:hypothetical protein